MARRLHLLPAGIAFLVPVSFIITYGIAVWEKDVSPFLPYVSSTGTKPPQSYIFSFMLNIAAYLLGTCVYLRYLYVKKYARFRHPRGIKMNKVAFWTGMWACFGLDLVANFQVSEVPLPHYIGAFLCFVGGTIYFYLQTAVSHKMVEGIEAAHLHVLRTWLSITAFCLLLVVISSGIAAKTMFAGSRDSERQWLPKERGYVLHTISAAGEWLLVLAQGALLLTFLPAFSCITIRAPVVKIEGLYESPSNQMHIFATPNLYNTENYPLVHSFRSSFHDSMHHSH